MDFGQPNIKIGRKMANGQLLFLVLIYAHVHTHIHMYALYIINQCR